CNN
ncbi:Protein FdhE, partial [Haemophilus influenzae]